MNSSWKKWKRNGEKKKVGEKKAGEGKLESAWPERISFGDTFGNDPEGWEFWEWDREGAEPLGHRERILERIFLIF